MPYQKTETHWQNHITVQEHTLADSPVEIGQAVPDFTAEMTSEKTFRLSDYKGKNVVLFFYPKDNTPGCTTESIAFRDAFLQFQQANSLIFGLSRDSIRSHEGFRAKLEMPFELISDPDEKVCAIFGVMKVKSMYGKKVHGIERSTFIIDANGQLVKEWRGVKVAEHVEEVLEFIKNLS